MGYLVARHLELVTGLLAMRLNAGGFVGDWLPVGELIF